MSLTHYVYILLNYRTLLNHPDLSPLTCKISLIVGQPGIGKSTFSIPIMKQRMMLGRPFFFTDPRKIVAYIWSPARGATIAPIANLGSLTADANNLWIMNQIEHGDYTEAQCSIVLLTSHRESNYKEFKKHFRQLIRVVYMPLPSEEEILAMAQTKSIDDVDEVRRRMSIVGRVPQEIFAVQFQDAINTIRDALKLCSFSADIFGSKVVSSGGDDLRSCLFVIDPDVDYCRKPDEFVSATVRDWYMHHWKEHHKMSFRQFIGKQ